MASIESASPLKAAWLAVLLSGLSPKNLALALAAGGGLAQGGVAGGEGTVGLIVFVIVASASVAGPVGFHLVGGQRATQVLDGWRSWLMAHSAALMVVLLLVFGVLLVSEGLGGLTS